MKLAIIGKGGSGKTFISIVLINLLSKYKNILAIDGDSNKNLIDYLFKENTENKAELGDFKAEIFEKAKVSKNEYERKYFPLDGIGAFSSDDEIIEKISYKKENLRLIQLGEPKEKRIGVTGICPYNETLKVFSSNLIENDDEIIFTDFAAGSEAASKGIVASYDNILIPLEPNSKNLDVAKDIFKTLKKIGFENVFFILNKIRNENDKKFIKDFFEEDIKIIGEIPFSKEIMKMDIKREINFENEIIQTSFEQIVKNILKMKKDKKRLERIKNLDILKGDKKCH